jgi:1-acyl-sn-glycerol-3-phosphate acyltransferase
VPRSEAARRASRLAAHLVTLYAHARLVAPRLGRTERDQLARQLARRMLDVLAVRVRVHGTPLPARGPLLVVANHVSWLDPYTLNAVVAARFVAKSEVARWPLVGGVARGFGSFFIVRGSVRDAARTKDRVAEALRAGERVGAFPEATTTDGAQVGAFHGALFQAAIDAGVPIQPVAVRYTDVDGTPSDAPVFVGDMTLAASLARVLAAPTLHADVRVCPAIPIAGWDRRELAWLSRRYIANALELNDRTEPPRARRRLRAVA